jgi:hypothetical protein
MGNTGLERCDEDFNYYNPYNPLPYAADDAFRMFTIGLPGIGVMEGKADAGQSKNLWESL